MTERISFEERARKVAENLKRFGETPDTESQFKQLAGISQSQASSPLTGISAQAPPSTGQTTSPPLTTDIRLIDADKVIERLERIESLLQELLIATVEKIMP